MARRHQFPRVLQRDPRRGDEETRETTPESSKGGRLMDDPQKLRDGAGPSSQAVGAESAQELSWSLIPRSAGDAETWVFPGHLKR